VEVQDHQEVQEHLDLAERRIIWFKWSRIMEVQEHLVQVEVEDPRSGTSGSSGSAGSSGGGNIRIMEVRTSDRECRIQWKCRNI
jgi:hypothetical protein